MTDILDEILAYTEGIQKREHEQQTHPRPTPTSTIEPTRVYPPQTQSNPTLPAHYLNPTFAPSPRGIQDDFSPFALLPRPSSYPAKPEHITCYTPPAPDHRPTTHEDAAAAAAAAIATPALSAHPDTVNRRPATSHRPGVTITPAPTGGIPVQFGVDGDVEGDGFHVGQTGWSTGTKRSFQTMENAGERGEQPPPMPPPGTGETREGGEKRAKTDAAVVMPPSAKSILERRERAIREGRRKDAKLTDAERRILRRLRNRESAERCRLRRVQQAAQLERKIETMQVENNRLVAMAEDYERTIKRLEKVIEDFNSQKS